MDRGDPVTPNELYKLTSRKFDDVPEMVTFKRIHLDPKKRNRFSTWLKRVFKKSGWVFRKKTVSQKIPDNWVEIAKIDALRIAQVMKANGIEVLINADETFIHFYPADKKVVAPEGSHRVGSNIEEDEKAGCTVMVSMEFFTSTLLCPFIVLEAKTEGCLARGWISTSRKNICTG